jgi:capsular exopolysaccharide synthesis family protein
MFKRIVGQHFRSSKGAKASRVQDEDRSGLSPRESVVSLGNPAGSAAEAYRTLRTNLLYSFVDDPPKVIVLTSAGPREGKSSTCANLGVVLAQAGKTVLVIDCDFRRPNLHKIFGTRNLWGVTDLLCRDRLLEDTCQEILPGLKLLSVGPMPSDPSELLGSNRFAEFLQQMREDFDYVLLDTPPLGLVTDPAILATVSDGVLLVLDAQRTRKWALYQSVRSLEVVGANVLGTVVTNVEMSDRAYRYDGYYTHDGSEGGNERNGSRGLRGARLD